MAGGTKFCNFVVNEKELKPQKRKMAQSLSYRKHKILMVVVLAISSIVLFLNVLTLIN